MTTAIAPIHGGGFVRTAFDVLAAETCAVGGEPLAGDDALPFGAGRVCAAHVFELTSRLRAARVGVLVQRHQRKETRRG